MDYLANLWGQYGDSVLAFAVAVLYLIGFYIAARVVKSLLSRVLLKTQIDNRFTTTVGLREDFPIEKVIAWTVFWVIMIFGLLTFFEKLGMSTATQPLNALLNEIFAYLPKFGAALVLLVVAWVLAALVKTTIQKGAGWLRLDERLNQLDKESDTGVTIGDSLATAGYWLVFLLFLPLVLGALEMESLVAPLQGMFAELFTYLPNVLSAAIIFAVGYFVARIVRQVVSSLLAAAGADKLSERSGMRQQLSTLTGAVVYAFILLLVIVQALDALQVAAISAPAEHMIDMIFAAVPGVIAAALVLGISWYVGRLVANLVTDLLTAAGFNNITEKLGMKVGLERTPSEYVGYLVLVGILLLAILGATELLNFEPLTGIVTTLIAFTVQVVLAAVILAIGIFLGKKAKALIGEAGMPGSAAKLAQAAILVLATAMALRQIGLAEDIIVLAFGLLLGALALGAAIAIGLGGKDIAGKELQTLIDRARK